MMSALSSLTLTIGASVRMEKPHLLFDKKSTLIAYFASTFNNLLSCLNLSARILPFRPLQFF